MLAIPRLAVPTENAAGAAFVRAATGPLHDRAEAVTRLPGSLQSPADVAGLLMRWRSLAATLEPEAGDLVPSLLPRIDDDLTLLGIARGGRGSQGSPPARAAQDAARLGVAWVLLGARLGLRSIAGHAEGLTGHRLGSMHATRPTDLRHVRAELDALGHDDLVHAADAAGSAFRVAISHLGGPPWAP